MEILIFILLLNQYVILGKLKPDIKAYDIMQIIILALICVEVVSQAME